MPKRRNVHREQARDVPYDEAFGELPTELLELVYAAKEQRGQDPQRLPSREQWEAMGKQGRLRYLKKRDRELPKLIREQEGRHEAERIERAKDKAAATLAATAGADEESPWHFYDEKDH